MDVDHVLKDVTSSADGLTTAEAGRRLSEHGPNRLSAPRRVPALRVLVDQFRSLVVLLLLAAAGVTLLIGDYVETAAIAAVLLINTAIGFAVELRARRAMEALLRYQVPAATALRDGIPRTVPADELVPGDVVRVGEGEAVPADMRLREAAGVRTDEASLTGESVPVDKGPEAVSEDTPLAERASMLYAGTSVAVGRATGVVVGTGMDTELGRIGGLLAGIEEGKTPLERRLDALGRRLIGLTLAIAAVVVGSGIVQGVPVGRMIEAGIALAIAAVPEGLPAVATIALAVGLRRMARRNAVIRRLSAVETLGSTTVVCTDKTGTLTAGQMTVRSVVTADGELSVSGSGYGEEGEITPAPEPRALFEAAALTPRARIDAEGVVTGDPTDAALLVLARKAGLDPGALEQAWPMVAEVPFSSDARLSVSVHRREEGPTAYVKGAPHDVLGRCTRAARPGHRIPFEPLHEELRERLEARNAELAREGLRVIALASSEPGEGDAAGGVPDGLTFLGLVGMIDPPAEGVAETVGRFRRAGIRTVMITGDQGPTAEAVARTLDILETGRSVLEGRALAAMDALALREAVEGAGVFSRVSPEDKLRIVAAYQGRGEIVAMLGDGVNDAAALKKADVGVAMGGRGTDVAKETADLVLQDDRFVTIGAAVEEGRIVYDNIRKFVFYLFSCNLAEVLVLLGGSLAGLPLPLLPLQILWLNQVTDTFPALALAMEPGEPDVMQRPPRDPEAAILSRPFIRSLAFFAALITAVTLAAYVWGLRTGPTDRAVTLSFVTLALAQLFHLGNARSRGPVLRPSRIVANPWALGAVPLVLALQLLAVHWPPLARVLGTVPLGPGEWTVALGLAAVPAVVGQAVEWWQARLEAAPATPDGGGGPPSAAA